MTNIPFYLHDLGRPELDSVAQVFRSPILTTGETVLTFEKRLAAYLGRRHVLAVSSCTGALHLSLLAMGIGKGDEVITTPMTFIATATAILEAGATPVFVDVEPDTGNLDAAQIEKAITKRTKAIMPVHLYGQMCNMKVIKRIADNHGLRIIEDAAHCIEGERDDVRPGQLSDTACFSFYATKNLTCGEGGALVTDNDELEDRLRLLRLHGMTKTAADRHKEGYQHWDMVMLGWKYNMDNIHAAILLPQLDRMEDNWKKREALSAHYEKLLADCPGIMLPKTLPGVRHARHLFPVWVQDSRRDEVVKKLQEAGIGVVVNYRSIHLLTYFVEQYGFRPGTYPVAERIGSSTVSIPFYPNLSHEHAGAVAHRMRQILTSQ